MGLYAQMLQEQKGTTAVTVPTTLGTTEDFESVPLETLVPAVLAQTIDLFKNPSDVEVSGKLKSYYEPHKTFKPMWISSGNGLTAITVRVQKYLKKKVHRKAVHAALYKLVESEDLITIKDAGMRAPVGTPTKFTSQLIPTRLYLETTDSKFVKRESTVKILCTWWLKQNARNFSVNSVLYFR